MIMKLEVLKDPISPGLCRKKVSTMFLSTVLRAQQVRIPIQADPAAVDLIELGDLGKRSAAKPQPLSRQPTAERLLLQPADKGEKRLKQPRNGASSDGAS